MATPGGFALLHELRLRARVQEFDETHADELCAVGFAVRKGVFLVLTPAGRDAHADWARLEPGSDEESAVRAAYERFLPLNVLLLQVSTDWQMRSRDVPNDHTDLAYDWAVIDRLIALDERAGPVIRAIGRRVDRFTQYRARLTTAVKRVEEGDHDWFLSPRCDSYHTVWMQLHEDLLVSLGQNRADEPGA